VPNDLAISGTSAQAKRGARSVRCIALLGPNSGDAWAIVNRTCVTRGVVSP
jgi:hypothetical protein